MEFRVLGPLEIVADGRPVRVGAPKQRAILAMLLIHANEVVSTDHLMEAVWGEEQPSGGLRTLRYHVSKLREALPADVIATRAPGYVLEVSPSQLDALTFEGLLAEARDSRTNDPAAALKLLDEALELWRGDAYADFTYQEFAHTEIVSLLELRLRALEDRFDICLELGREGEVIGELQRVVGEHPRRERLVASLMLALYRSGRQAESLSVYRDLRRELGESLGIEPSQELRDLEERILLQDSSLAEVRATPAEEFLRGYVLRGRIGEGAHGVVWRAGQPGVGREVAIKAIHPDISNRPGFVRRFEREAQLVASLEHPHIVSLFDFWRDPEGAFLVMPYLRGGDLDHLLQQGPLRPDAALELIRAIGGALAYAHRRGVIHRDVTPHNVLLDDEGHPYLADFGVATLVGETGPPISSSPVYLSPEQHAGKGTSPQSDVYSLGVLMHAVLTGQSPVVGEELRPVSSSRVDLAATVDEIIEVATSIDMAERYDSPEALVADLSRALGAAAAAPVTPVTETRNPYKGLRAFAETDAGDFFGRESLESELVQAVSRHRLVGVVGPSGCGKSSLVRAGLIPLLRGGVLPGSDEWLITDMYPGSQPFSELQAALLRVAVDMPERFGERLVGDAAGRSSLLGELLPPDTELLLIVDQFEELFTLSADQDIRSRFLEALAEFAGDPLNKVRLVVTLRADFYGRPLEYPEFAELLRMGLVTIAVPGEDDLVKAVAGPAQRVGLEVEPGLAERITHDVAGQPGGLPLLEYALTELFQRRAMSQLTLAGYEQTGGVLGALGRRAEDLYAGRDGAGQRAVQQVFLRLVTVEEGSEDTRRRIPLTELHSMGLDREVLQQVLDDYGSHRLLTFDRDPGSREPTVEVAHEALLGRWERLRTWIDDRRDDLVLRRRLVAAVDEWRASGQRTEYLVSGGRLDHFESFAGDTDLAIGAEESAYLAESRRHSDELATRRTRRRRGIMAGFAAAAVIAAVFAVVALIAQRRAEDASVEAQQNQRLAQEQAARADEEALRADEERVRAEEERDRAEQQAGLNRSRVLAAASIDAIGEDDQLALLLGLEAADVSLAANGEVLPEAADAIHRSLRASRLESAVSLDSLPVGRSFMLAASSSGLVAVSSTGDTVELRHGDDIGTVVATLGVPLEGADTGLVQAPAFAPDGASVAVVGSDGTVRVWDVDSGTEIWSQPRRSPGRGGVVYSPDGARLLSAAYTTVVMWDAASGEEIWAAAYPGGLEALPAFSPDGTRLAVGTWGSTDLTVLDVESGEELSKRDTPTSVGSLHWSPDGTHLLVGLLAGDIHVVDAAALDVIDIWEGHSATPWSMAIDSAGTRLATGADDGTVRMWDLATGGELMVLGAGTGTVDGVAFLPGDRHLVATGNDRMLRLYDVSPEGRGEVFAARTGGEELTSIDINADGTRLASLAYGGEFNPGGITIWDVATGSPQLTIDGLDWFSFDGVTFTPDGEGFVVQEWNESLEPIDVVGVGWGPVQLRDVATGRVLMSFAETEGQERQTPGFSADGSVLATGSTASFADYEKEERMSTAAIHDATTGELLHRLDHADWAVSAVAPSPSGDRLATATCDRGIVTVWDVASETILWTAEYPGCSTGIAFSPDGSFIAASSLDQPPAVWDARTGEKRFDIVGHSGGAYSIEISPDGSAIASAGADGSVLVVDSSTGELLTAIQVADVALGDVGFSPDGETLAAATLDGSLYVFALDPEQLLDLARTRVVRILTEAECATYDIDPCPASDQG